MPPFLVPTQKKSHDLMPILLSLLTMDNADLIYPLHQVTESIERLLTSDPNRKALITPYVWKMLTDIQVLEEMNRQLVRYCPRLRRPACRYNAKFNGVNRYSCKDNNELGQKVVAFAKVLMDSKLGTLLAPDGNNFYYPAEKQRSEHHKLSMQKAEQRLDILWGKIDDLVQQKFDGKTIAEMFPSVDFSDCTLQRTGDWVAPLKLQPSRLIDDGVESYQSFGPQGEPSVGQNVKAVRIKAKAKTRGIPTSGTATNIVNASSDHSPIIETIDSLFETKDMIVS